MDEGGGSGESPELRAEEKNLNIGSTKVLGFLDLHPFVHVI